MPANLENSAVVTGIRKGQFSFQSQGKAMPKNVQTFTQTTHFTCQQGNAQNSPSEASTVCETRISGCSSWIQKRQRNQKSHLQHLLNHQKSKRNPGKHLLYFIDYTKAFDCVDHNKLWNILKEMGLPPDLPPQKPICRSRSNSQTWIWKKGLFLNWERSI